MLVETAIELVPGKYRGHPSVLNNVKKLGNPGRLLDSALHHSFMKNLENHAKRGRPDILHQYMITCLTSILNKNNFLRIYFHTYNGEIYEINPILRPPKDYLRYKGLIYKLLIDKQISTLKPAGEKSGTEDLGNNSFLIRNIKLSLQGFIKQVNPSKILRFTSKGRLTSHDSIFDFIKHQPEQNILAIVGGFQSGSYSPSIMEIQADDVSIYPEGLETNTVLNHIIINYEYSIGI